MKTTRLFNSEERECVRKLVLMTKVEAWILIVACSVVLIAVAVIEVMNPELATWGGNLGALCAIFGSALIVCLTNMSSWRVPKDAKKGEVTVVTDPIIRVYKVGLFEMKEGLDLAAFFMGAIYYVSFKDESKRSGKRRLRIALETYRYLLDYDRNKDVEIAYLPHSNKLFHIKTDDYQYTSYHPSHRL